MNVSPKLMNLTKQIDTHSETAHRLSTSARKIDDKVVSPTLAEDVYHKGEHVPKDSNTYNKPLNIAVEYTQTPELEAKTVETLYNKLPSNLSLIRPEFKKLQSEIENKIPALQDKRWSYTVDGSGKLIATGKLNDQERDVIESALNKDQGFVALNQSIPDLLSEGVQLDRTFYGRSRNWGKYEVTKENFKDIIDMKSLLQSTETQNSDKSFNKVDFFSYTQNLAGQLARKAEVKYGF